MPLAALRHDETSNLLANHWTMKDVEAIKRRIAELQLEHRGLDSMIEALGPQNRLDELQLRRLKKRKLQIKDTILLLQMQLVPDVPA